jgi:signal transduction histidine kinase
VQYYYLNKESTLKETYEKINDIYQGQPFDVLLNLEKIERTEGLHIVIRDSFYVTKYDSSYKEEDFFHKPSNPRFVEIIIPGSPEHAVLERTAEVTRDHPIIQKSNDRRLNSEFINLVGLLDNGDYIFLSTPVIAIEESAEIANKFFSITGLVTIFAGLVIVFIFAGRFTKPILQLNEIAQRMAKLDFSKKYTVTTYDEIGELGESINSLSDQLEKSITELRQANEKLIEDIQRERKIDEMRKEFISNVSHELKTPIALIQGYAEGLKVNVNESEEDKNFYCEVIVDESGKMNKLVKELLDLSQIDTGYVRLDKTDFDLTQLVEYVLKKNALLIKEQHIRLIREMQQDVMVHADIHRIEQIVVNYLINAIHHADRERVIQVTVNKEKDKARVTIYNSGDPIPEESLEKIWTSFYKEDRARTRSYGGTGLGLSIVRAIQDVHHNRYGADNLENGVAFWFEVDLAL